MKFSRFVNAILTEERNLGETMEDVFAIAIALHMAYGRVDKNLINTIRRSLDLSNGKATHTIDPNIATDNIYGIEADANDKISVKVEIRLRPSKVEGMFGNQMVVNPRVDAYIDALARRVPDLNIMKKIHGFMMDVLTNHKKDEIDFFVIADGVSTSSSKNTLKGDVKLKISAKTKTDIPKDIKEPITFSLKAEENATKNTVSNMGIFVGLFRLCKLFKLRFIEGLEGLDEFPDRYSKMQEVVYQHPDKIPDEDHFIHYVKKYMTVQDRYFAGGGEGESPADKKAYQATEELDVLKSILKRFIQAMSEEIQMKDSDAFNADPRARVFTMRCLEFLRSQIFGEDVSRVISIKQDDIKELAKADFDAMKDQYVVNLQTDDNGNMKFYSIDINNEKKLLFQIRPRLEYNLKNGKKTQTLMVEVGDLI
jgi:hypothetical protein